MTDKLTITSINLRCSYTAVTSLISLDKADIYLVQEPPLRGVCCQDYTYIDQNRVGILFHNSLKRQISVISRSDMTLVISVGSDSNNSIIVGSIYIPPKIDTTTVLTQLESVLDNHAADRLVLGGDFNAINQLWQSSIKEGLESLPVRRGRKLEQLLLQRGVSVVSTDAPTHHRGNTIDFFITNNIPSGKIQ